MKFAIRTVPALLLLPLAAAEVEATRVYTRAGLVERTPFSKSDKPGKAESGGPLELRGFFGTGANLEVSLMRSGTSESVWLRVGDTGGKWVVESADPVAGTADVRYDGLLLHLKLARPEVPELTVKPVEKEPAEPRSGRRGGWSSLSPATQEILRNSMRESMEALRKSNPEYFDGTPLSDEQRKAFAAVREANFAKVREAVAKSAPEDLARLDEMQARMSARFREPRPEAAPSGESAKPAPKN